jgi:hypothetical protein
MKGWRRRSVRIIPDKLLALADEVIDAGAEIGGVEIARQDLLLWMERQLGKDRLAGAFSAARPERRNSGSGRHPCWHALGSCGCPDFQVLLLDSRYRRSSQRPDCVATGPLRAHNALESVCAQDAHRNILLRKMIPDAFPLLVREPNHSTFISDRQQSAILK